MTVSAKIDLLQRLPAFRGCSAATFERLNSGSEIVSLGVGQPLSSGSLVPERVLLIVSGKARLLGHNSSQLSTLALLGPGNFIGLSSGSCRKSSIIRSENA